MAKDTKETIEFYIPSAGLELETYLRMELPPSALPKQFRLRKQAIHHLARYHWAVHVLSGEKPGRVLDLACGAGYGSSLLAKGLPGFEIIGGDYDPRAVEIASERFGGPANLRYRQADIVTWTDVVSGAPLGEFDYVVSFDTVEHLLHREIALVNLAENIALTGALLFSTPCGKQANLLNPGWEHHKIEYSYLYLFNLMKRFFQRVQLPDDGTLPHLDFWKNVVNGGEERYLLRANPMVCKEPLRQGLGWFGAT